MYQRDAAKARIKKLEGDMLGLVQALKRLSTQPSAFFTPSPTVPPSVSSTFNGSTTRGALHKSFQMAGRAQEELQLQISSIRNELAHLQIYTVQAPEFRMAA